MPSRSQRERTRDRVLRGRDLAVGLSAADNAAEPVDDDETPKLDLSDPDSECRNYLETCWRLGVEPTPRERVQDLMAKWSEAIAGRPDAAALA